MKEAPHYFNCFLSSTFVLNTLQIHPRPRAILGSFLGFLLLPLDIGYQDCEIFFRNHLKNVKRRAGLWEEREGGGGGRGITETGWPLLLTANSIFLLPESTTSMRAFTANRTVASSERFSAQFFSRNSLTAFSFLPPIALA